MAAAVVAFGLAAPASAALMAGSTTTLGPTVVSDSFDRDVAGSLGKAPVGGNWSLSGSASPANRYASISSGSARLVLPSRGKGLAATLRSTPQAGVDIRAGVAVSALATGTGTYVSVVGRQVDGVGAYGLKLRFLPTGGLTFALVRTTGATEKEVAHATVPGVTYVAGRTLQARLQVAGASPTQLSAKVWASKTSEPGSWQLQAKDSTGALQRTGAVGVAGYLSGKATKAPVTVRLDAISARSVLTKSTAPAPVPTPAPVPAPASGTSRVKPVAANTGVPAGVTLKQHYGNLTIKTAGAVYDGLDIHGYVVVEAPNVTIRRSIIRGGAAATGSTGLVNNYQASATNLLIEDSELVPEHPTSWVDGVKGANFTLRRVDIHGTVDGSQVHGNNVRIESSWIHDLHHYAKDPLHNNGTHNDGVQVFGGTNITVVGNSISGASNAALMVSQSWAPTVNVQFLENWLDGGGCTVNITNVPRATLSGVTLKGNLFGRNSGFNCPIIRTGKVSLSTSGNVWGDSLQVVPVITQG